MKTLTRPLEFFAFVLALIVWTFSFYDILNELRLTEIFRPGAVSNEEVLPISNNDLKEINNELNNIIDEVKTVLPVCDQCPTQCPTPTPSVIPTPTPTPTGGVTPTPTPTSEVTPTPTPTPGPTATPTPSSGGGVGGEVLSSSSASNPPGIGGEVLGTYVLGATGSIADQIFQLLFIIGSLCASAGLKFLFPTKKLV